jgi:uncharacterized protein (TIGR03066 family)
MKVVWAAVAACLTLALIGTAGGQDKKGIDKAKLIGVWEVVKAEAVPPGTTIEFLKGDKLIVNTRLGGEAIKVEGDYKVDGDKISYTLRAKGQEFKNTGTIRTLSDTTLVVVDEKGVVEEYKRKK